MGSFDSQFFILELDGKPVGKIFDFQLPQARADVISEPIGVGISGRTRTRITQRPGDFSFKCRPGMSRSFFDWTKDVFQSRNLPKNGAIVAADPDQTERLRIEFSSAFITGVSMPGLAKPIRDEGMIEIAFKSEDFKVSTVKKQMLANPYLATSYSGLRDFKLTIENLEKECSGVGYLGPVGVGEALAVSYDANSRVPVLSPSRTTVREWSISLPNTTVDGFTQWFEKIIKGDASANVGRTGSIEYFSSNSKTADFIVNLTGINIAGIVLSGAPGTASKTVKMFCDSAEFSATSSATK